MNLNNFKIDAFVLGVPKAASTWIYHCFKEHDQIYVPGTDSIRFFDMHFDQGIDWYKSYYSDALEGQLKIDATPAYFRSPIACEKIYSLFPDAKFILTFRDPVKRAFSQYWHEKQIGNINLTFENCTTKYLPYAWIIETGFYASHLKKFLAKYPRNNFLFQKFDTLEDNPRLFLENIYSFLSVSKSFSPMVIDKKVNVAKHKSNVATKSISQLSLNSKFVSGLKKYFKLYKVKNHVLSIFSSKKEYSAGLSDEMTQKLYGLYREEINELGEITGLNLSNWKR